MLFSTKVIQAEVDSNKLPSYLTRLHSPSKETQHGKLHFFLGRVTQGHQEKWVQKSCVSFEEECIMVKGRLHLHERTSRSA